MPPSSKWFLRIWHPRVITTMKVDIRNSAFLASWGCIFLNMSPVIGTAMHTTTRKALGVHGLSPSRIESLEIQKRRALSQLRSKHTMLEKYIFMAQMRNTNIRLFYKIVCDELEVRFFFFVSYPN